MFLRIPLALLALGLTTHVIAGPKEDLHVAFTKFMAQTSFKCSITGTANGKALHEAVEFQAPDRYRVLPEGHPAMVIIGDTIYHDVNGHATKVKGTSLGKMIAQYRDPDVIAKIESSKSVEDLGQDNVGGVAAHKYSYSYSITEPQVQKTGVVWISNATGLPIQRQSSGTAMGKAFGGTVNCSNFSDPTILISAPN